jgi:hypothetical protein
MEIYVLRNLANDNVTAHTTVTGVVREMLSLPASVDLPQLYYYHEIEAFVCAYGWQRKKVRDSRGLILSSTKKSVDYQLCPHLADPHDTQWIAIWKFEQAIGLHPHTLMQECRDSGRALASLRHTIETAWLCPADLNHPNAPAGAAFQGDICYRLYRRTPLPDFGPAHCAAVVKEVAADGVLPVVGVPELVASFL